MVVIFRNKVIKLKQALNDSKLTNSILNPYPIQFCLKKKFKS